MSYSKWIYSIVAFVFLAGTITYVGMSERTAKSILIKGCDYWEYKGQSQWCEEPLINQLEITKCDKQLYIIRTNNNYCADLIISGGGGKRFYSKYSRDWIVSTQKKCGIPDYLISQRGLCK